MLNVLSKRENEILYHCVKGKTAKLIAKTLNLSPRTIEQHLENIKHKIGVSSKSELIEKAIDNFSMLPHATYQAESTIP